MEEFEVVIVGGGLAGSMAAAMLSKSSIKTALVDPHLIFPSEFRCEKFSESHASVLTKAGLGSVLDEATTIIPSFWLLRYGFLLDRIGSYQYGFAYEDLVNAVRRRISGDVQLIQATASHVSTSEDTQCVTLSDGRTLSCRLVVLATGLNQALRGSLGISQLDLDHQSVSFGFNLVSEQPDGFQFGALTSYHEQVDGKTAFITLFRLGPTMRANLFVYRQAKDPWFRAMRDAPTETLDHTFPRLKRVIGGFRVVGRVQGRVSNLTVAQDHQRPGVVLVGDAWMTPCPAAGVGAMRTMNDVEILCRSHLSGWLSSPGMSWAKIASFYADREKCECDEMAVARALHFRRLLTDSGLRWRADRYLKFCGRGAKGLIRRIRGRLRFGPEADEGSFSTFLPSDSQPDRVPGGSRS